MQTKKQGFFEGRIGAIRGIGLLELMLSLAIIAVLLITATRYFKITSDTRKVNEAVGIVQAVVSAGTQWQQLRGDFTVGQDMIPAFVGDNLLPEDFDDANLSPWGGSVTAMAISATKLTLTIEGVGVNTCFGLLYKVEALAKELPAIDATTGACDAKGYSIDMNF